MKPVRIGLFCGVFFALVVSFNNCGSFESLSSLTADDVQSDGGVDTPPAAVDDNYALTSFSKKTMNLGQSQVFSAQVVAGDDYNGSLSLQIDRSQLDLIDAEGDVKVDVEPKTLFLSSGQSANIQVTVETSSMSPSFISSSISLKADDVSKGRSVSSPMELEVMAIYEYGMLGDDPDPANRWNRSSDPMSFRDHSSGLLLRFVNYAAADTHIVHGNGMIPHQNTNAPLAASPNPGVAPGGVYEVVINSGSIGNGSFYYHDIENNGNRREVSFGVSSQSTALAFAARGPASENMVLAASNSRMSCDDPIGTDN